MDNRRKHTRFTAAVAAEVDTGDQVLEGETRDISVGGVSVLVDEPVPEGVVIGVSLILTEDGIESAEEDPLHMRAHVMWAAPTDSGACLLGLRFSRLAPEDLLRLQRFLAAISETTR